MTDKLTDKDIIKALPNMTYGGHYCAKCKYDNGKGNDRCGLKGCKIARYALDLITRQQAENENLKVKLQSMRGAANSLKMHYEEAQAEVERLKRELDLVIENSISARYPHCVLCGNGAILTKSLEEYDELIADISAEAYKEFTKRLKEFMHNKFKALDEYEFEYITERDIDNLVKEMVGDDNA